MSMWIYSAIPIKLWSLRVVLITLASKKCKAWWRGFFVESKAWWFCLGLKNGVIEYGQVCVYGQIQNVDKIVYSFKLYDELMIKFYIKFFQLLKFQNMKSIWTIVGKSWLIWMPTVSLVLLNFSFGPVGAPKLLLSIYNNFEKPVGQSVIHTLCTFLGQTVPRLVSR